MAHGAWKCIKSEVCNLKTMGTKVQKYSLFIPRCCFEMCTYTDQHDSSGALHIFCWLSFFLYNKAYFLIRSQPALYDFVWWICGQVPAPALLWDPASICRHICEGAISRGSFILVTIHLQWKNDGSSLVLQIRNTNLVLWYWSRLYRSVLLGKYVNIFTATLWYWVSVDCCCKC